MVLTIAGTSVVGSWASVSRWRIVLTTILVIVLGSLAAGAGVGGGGLFVPIYWLILGVGPLAAVPLSKATILGGAIGNFASLGRMRHPQAQRPLIDYEASTFMQSGELLGVIFGVLLNILLPPVAIIVFLILVLSYNTKRTLRKGFSTRKKEDAAFAAKRKDSDEATEALKDDDPAAGGAAVVHIRDVDAAAVAEAEKEEESKGGLASGYPPSTSTLSSDDPTTVPASRSHEALLGLDKVIDHSKAESDAEAGLEKAAVSPELLAVLDEDSEQFPGWAWRLLGPMTIFTVMYAVIKVNVLSKCEPISYWIWFFVPIPVLGAFMYYTAEILKKRHTRRVAAGFNFLPTDLQWTDDMLKKFPNTALIAGVTAGLLGIGGGMIIGPLFLDIGMQPQVGTSSCAFMILWTAASGVIQYFFYGKLGLQLTAWCVAFGFVSGQIGQHAVNKILRDTGRPSYVIFLLAAIIGLACTAMTAAGLSNLTQAGLKGDPIFFLAIGEFKCH